MRTDKALNPYSAPKDFRAYVYDKVILTWETQPASIISSVYKKDALKRNCELDVFKIKKLEEVQQRYRDRTISSKNEFFIFYNDGKGYECLFKRLRDTFAHGDYEQTKRGWITLKHEYKNPRDRDKVAKIRAFGCMKISTFEKLITFLTTKNSH